MLEAWIWGRSPSGFCRIENGRARMIIREGLEPYLLLDKFKQGGAAIASSPFQGRERLRRFRMENGETVLVRAYRHGGVLRDLSRDCFSSRPPRPFKELAVTVEAARRGVPTLEVLGAWVEAAWGPFYRGWLVSRELTEARDLWAVLQNGSAGGSRKELLAAVARTIRLMHRRGVCHGDLNLRNILIRREGRSFRSYLIDFDKALLFPGEVPPRRAERNLRRILRSIGKLDPARRHVTGEDWDGFIRAYGEAERE